MSFEGDSAGGENAGVGPDRAVKFERTKRRDMMAEMDRQVVYAHGHMGKLDKVLEQIANPIARDKLRAFARARISEHLQKGGEFNPPTMAARAKARNASREELDHRGKNEARRAREAQGRER